MRERLREFEKGDWWWKVAMFRLRFKNWEGHHLHPFSFYYFLPSKADKATKARGLQRAALIGLVPRSQALSSSTQALELEPHHRPPIAVQFLNNLTQVRVHSVKK